jgi:hypothetical protein
VLDGFAELRIFGIAISLVVLKPLLEECLVQQLAVNRRHQPAHPAVVAPRVQVSRQIRGKYDAEVLNDILLAFQCLLLLAFLQLPGASASRA